MKSPDTGVLIWVQDSPEHLVTEATCDRERVKGNDFIAQHPCEEKYNTERNTDG